MSYIFPSLRAGIVAPGWRLGLLVAWLLGGWGLPAYAQPGNNNCATASSYSLTPTPYPGITFTAGTTAGATQSYPAVVCAGGNNGNADDDVWYSFVAPATEATVTLDVSSSSPFDGVIDLRGPASDGCGSSNIACRDFGGPGFDEILTYQFLAPGTRYYIRVYSYGGSSQAGPFNIAVTYNQTDAPTLTAPANGATVGTLTPTYTGTAYSGSTVFLYVDGALVGSTTASGGTFSFTQPSGAPLTRGNHTVYATAQRTAYGVSPNSPTRTFTVALPPTLTGLSPTSGFVGTSVGLTGTEFTGVTGVSFNGTAATTYTVNSATSITATVPTGATTGNVTVTTPGGTSATGAANVFTVTVPNQAPSIAAQTRSVAENTANGTNVGAPVGASDPDAGQTLTYAITAGNAAGTFAINGSTGQLTVAGFLDFEGTATYALTVQVTDNSAAPLSSSATVTVNVTNANDAPGLVTDANAAASAVAENAATGTPVGITAAATDPDAGTTLTYVLVDDAGGRFQIDASTGVVSVANGSLLDYETLASYDIEVRATDGSLTGPHQFFTIAVTDVAEPPTVAGFAPASGLSGSLVTLTGTNLDLVRSVRFGASGVPTTQFTARSATSLTVRVPEVVASGPLTVVSPDGTVSTSGSFTVRPRQPLTATLSPAGPLDVCQPRTLTATAATPAFNALGTGFNGEVKAVAVQADGKVVVGGAFTSYNGVTTNYVARLNADGSLDTTFAPVGTGLNGTVWALVVQADGRVLVGGAFSRYNGDLRTPERLVRLHADGTLDYTFIYDYDPGDQGLNGTVYALTVQADGKVVVGGEFTKYKNDFSAPDYVLRLTADGSPDGSFVPPVLGNDAYVTALALQADGKVLVGGSLNPRLMSGWPDGVLRLHANGSVDATFNPGGTGINHHSAPVYALAVQADGKVLVGGGFTAYNGAASAPNNVLRLNPDGLLDATFNSGGAGTDTFVNALAMQADGKVLVGGSFTAYNGAAGAPDNVLRLHADGSLDAAFNNGGGGADDAVIALAAQADGKVLVGGRFTAYNGAAGAPDHLLRLTAAGLPDDAATAVSGATFTFSPGATTANPLVASTAGTYAAVAALNGNTSAPSNAVVLTACPAPTLTSLSPTSGSVGTSVNLTGTNFTSGATVFFNGTAAGSVTVHSTTSLTAVVPAGATTGPVTVTTPGGTTGGVTFTVTAPANLTISTGSAAAPVAVAAGTYTSITVTATGYAVLDGPVVSDGPVAVSGTLLTNCQPLTGAGTFTVQAGATLGICHPQGISASGATGAVQVTGACTFAADATYVYNGTQAQSTGSGLPATVRALETANAAGVTLSQALAVTDVLRLTSGTLQTEGKLTLLSPPTRTAYAVHAGGLTSGAVTVQRYVGGPNRSGYRHLASPVQSAPVSDLNTSGFTAKVNPAYNALPYVAPPTAQYPTVFGYDDTRGGTNSAFADFNTGYFSPASLSSVLTPGRGWTVYMPGGKTPDFAGALTTDDVPMSLTVTGTNTNPNQQKSGWHLLGNPYPQPIDWDLASVPTGMSASISVFRTQGGNNGQYLTRANGVGTLPDGLLALGQAFFARVTAPVTFTFTNALRVEANPATVARPTQETRPLLRLRLAAVGAPAQADEAFVYVQAGATTGIDEAYDGFKPGRNTGAVPTLATLIEGQEAAVNGLPLTVLTTPTVVDLVMALPTAGSYTLAVPTVANLPAGTTAELLDRLTNTHYDLRALPVLTLHAAQANEVLTGRFSVLFNAGTVTGTTPGTVAAAPLVVYPNPVAQTLVRVTGCPASQPVDVFDLAGRRVATTVADANGVAVLAARGLAAGTYVVRTADGRTTKLMAE